MNAMLLNQLSVPCIAKVRENKEKRLDINEKYYLNPLVTIRYEPEGATILPLEFDSPSIFVDKELAFLLQEKEFSARGLSLKSFDLLIKNKIISEQKPKDKDYHEFSTCVDGLPIHASFDITSRCNCNCISCYHKGDMNGYEPPLRDIFKRIEHIKKLGMDLIEVTGGEALLREDISEILERMLELGIKFYIITNGEYLKDLDREVIVAIKKSLNSIVVSIDGVGDIHDQIRKRPGLYNNILKGLDFIKKNDIKPYFVSTIHDGNVACIPNIVRLAEKYDAIAQFRPIINAGGAKLNNIKLSHLHEGFYSLKGKNVLNNFLATNKEISPSRYYGCSMIKKLSIDVNGYIYPCLMDRSKKIDMIETYTQKTLSEDLNKEFEQLLCAHSKCRLCKINKNGIRCAGFCRFSQTYKNGI